MNWFQAGIRSGNPIESGRQRLTPRNLVVEIHWPWGGGGLIYNHPVAVSVETDGGAAKTLPILDITLMVQIYLFIWALIMARILWRTNHD